MNGNAIDSVFVGLGMGVEGGAQEPVGAVVVPKGGGLNGMGGLELLGEKMLVELGTANVRGVGREGVEEVHGWFSAAMR